MQKKMVNTIQQKLFFYLLHDSKASPERQKHTPTHHCPMQRVLPPPEACTLPWDNPPSGKCPPVSGAQLLWERAPQAAGFPASRNPGDADRSVSPQSRGDRCSGPRGHTSGRLNREGCSGRAYTRDALHPTSSWAGPIRS